MKWIQLTNEDGFLGYVNPAHIVAAFADEDGGGTRLILSNEGTPKVKEQLDQVMLKLEASQT